jgi:hypothetical protein
MYRTFRLQADYRIKKRNILYSVMNGRYRISETAGCHRVTLNRRHATQPIYRGNESRHQTPENQPMRAIFREAVYPDKKMNQNLAINSKILFLHP